MRYLDLILLCFWLSLIIYQDFKFRAIPLYCLIGLSINCFILGLLQNSVQDIAFNILQIFIFLIFLISGLFLYYLIKNKKITPIINVRLGLGDLLFFVSIASLFSLPGFLFFFITSNLCAILYYLFRILKDRNNKMQSIPLAGLQSLCLLGIIITNELYFKTHYPTDIFYFFDKIIK